MAQTHTPGPWVVDDAAQPAHMAQCLLVNPTWVAVEDSADDGGHVAYCAPVNAPLIAAAPAMLAALQGMVRGYREAFGDAIKSDGREGGAFAEYFAAVDAIAAATGTPTDGNGTAAPTDEKRGPGLWRIVQGEPDTPGALYWSNRDGWGGLAGSDGFSDAERQTLNLPMGGAWWFDADDHGACASCGAWEGESHGPRCEARGFAMGVAAATGER